MKNLLILIVGLLIGAGGFWLFSRHPADEKKAEEKAHEETNPGGAIKLDQKQQAAAGIETTEPKAARFPEEIKGYGRVLDPAPLVTLALDVQAARAALDASEKDFERVKVLHAQNQNVSARAFETAEAAAKRDRALLNVAEAKLHTTLGPTLAARENLPELLDALAKMKWALVRLDVISGAPGNSTQKIRIAALADESATVEAEFLGRAPAAETSIQGRGFLALAKTNSLAPNTAVVGWFELSGRERPGFLIPRKALLQESGDTIVFLQISEDTFKKQPIEVDRVTDDGAFVTEGVAATNRVVTSGAHQLLSVTKAGPAD